MRFIQLLQGSLRKRPLCCVSNHMRIHLAVWGYAVDHRRPAVMDSHCYYSSTSPMLRRGHKMKVYRDEKRSEVDGRDSTSKRIQKLKVKIKNLSGNVQPRSGTKENRPKKANQPKTDHAPTAMKEPFSVFIACLPGLEPLLLQEVQYLLGLSGTSNQRSAKEVPGGVETLVPTLTHLYVLHLYLGTASHIYLRLNDNGVDGVPPLFRARGFPELKRKLAELMLSQRWDRMLGIPRRSGTGSSLEACGLPWQLKVHVVTSKSKLMHTKAVEERVRETIGDVLGIKALEKGVAESADAKDAELSEETDDRPIIRLLVRIERDDVQISLDTSSSPLHRRGYRLDPYLAPLREDLAFALLKAGGLEPHWSLPLQAVSTSNKRCRSRSLDLFDPMCGSGTIAIEAASILVGLPPGRLRPTPLQGTALCDPKLWNGLISLAKSKCSKHESKTEALVAACDISKKAIKYARLNAERAGVGNFIGFGVQSFETHKLLRQMPKPRKSAKPLLVVTNPPYGKRITSSDQMKASIYKQLGKALWKACTSSRKEIRCAIVGKDPRLMRGSSMPLEVAFSTKQGGLSVAAMTSTLMRDESKKEDR